MTATLLLVVKATVILAAAFGADALLRKRSVLLCTALWNAVLLALLVLPIAVLMLPTLPVPLIPAAPIAMTAPAAAPAESGRSQDVETSPAMSVELTSQMPFQVIVEAEGYQPLALPRVVAKPEADAVAVDAALKKREPIVPAELSGQVIDHQGAPVGGVELRLIVSTSPSDGDQDNRFNWVLIETGQLAKKDYVAQYLSAVTDDDGKFELKGLLPGKFLQLAYWGPNAPKGRTLALAKTKPGASQSVMIRLPEPAAIRGSFDAAAFPKASRMSLTLQGQPFHHYQLDLAHGKSDFAFENLPPGKYWLSVVGQPQRHADNPQLFSYPPLASRRLTLESGKTLEVRLTEDDQAQGAKR